MVTKDEIMKLFAGNSEAVLAIIKPDGVIRRKAGLKVIKRILKLPNLEMLYFGIHRPDKKFIGELHYSQHKGKFFYNWLIRYMSTYDIILLVFSGFNIIQRLRELAGNTLPERADKGTLRYEYGIYGGVNIIHISDSQDTAVRELQLWSSYIEYLDEKTALSKYLEYYDYVSNLNVKYLHSNIYRIISDKLKKGCLNRNEALDIFTNILVYEFEGDSKVIDDFSSILVENALLRDNRQVSNESEGGRET